MKNRIGEWFVFLALLVLTGLPARAQDVIASLSAPPASSSEAAGASAAAAPRPASWGVPESRLLFPHNWIRGYIDFDVAGPHNEPDLGRCSQSGAVINAAGGASSNCNAYARYMLGGYLEIQPFGKTLARHLFLFFTPTFSFGNNVPQHKYTWSPAGIAMERSIGFGFELPKNFEIRVQQHQVDWLGKYNHEVGLADLGTAGPYGLYSTVGARWTFGGYGRQH